MAAGAEETLISVWRQVMVDKVECVILGDQAYAVQRTSRSRLREVSFQLQGVVIRAVEQNPATHSRWAALAREGKAVMQFLEAGRYLANVVDGKLMGYQALEGRFPAKNG